MSEWPPIFKHGIDMDPFYGTNTRSIDMYFLTKFDGLRKEVHDLSLKVTQIEKDIESLNLFKKSIEEQQKSLKELIKNILVAVISVSISTIINYFMKK